MRTARVLLGVCILSLSCFAANPPAQNDSVNKIIQASLQASSLQDNLRRLTDEIGGRVPGTPAMQHAVQWGMQAFTAAGAESVRTESFEIPYSWSEGNTEMTATTAHQISSGGVGGGTVLSSFRVRAVSVAWAPALALVKHVPVVDVGEGTDADFQKAGDISGKIALVHTTVLKKWADLFAEYANAPPIVDRAVKAKVKAIAFMATREHDILYRHTNSGAGEIDKLPMVIVAKEDGERIARLLAAGNLVWADLSIPDQVGGPIKSSNVIAEIRGREIPEEFVIVGAHLDSWELGTGALDNGCNAALVIDAMRAIRAAGVTPRRSIRFILFSGEEQGLLGSRMYAFNHRAELDRAAGVIWFVTDLRSDKEHEIENASDVGLVFSDADAKAYLSLTARAEVLRDHKQAATIWKSTDNVWWHGPDDPNVCVLKITPLTAELWDGPSSKAVAAFEFVKARLTGEKPNLGENRKVTVDLK